MSYILIASNIDNVRQAHIHIGPPGVNGPVTVFLFGPVPPEAERRMAFSSTGSFTAADFIGPLAGQPMSALIAEIEANNAYVNVHTDDGVAPPNTGPGDFPGGEIRGPVPD